jgi:hypothetical protein
VSVDQLEDRQPVFVSGESLLANPPTAPGLDSFLAGPCLLISGASRQQPWQLGHVRRASAHTKHQAYCCFFFGPAMVGVFGPGVLGVGRMAAQGSFAF